MIEKLFETIRGEKFKRLADFQLHEGAISFKPYGNRLQLAMLQAKGLTEEKVKSISEDDKVRGNQRLTQLLQLADKEKIRPKADMTTGELEEIVRQAFGTDKSRIKGGITHILYPEVGMVNPVQQLKAKVFQAVYESATRDFQVLEDLAMVHKVLIDITPRYVPKGKGKELRFFIEILPHPEKKNG